MRKAPLLKSATLLVAGILSFQTLVSQSSSGKQLLISAREGELSTVTSLLKQGVDTEVRDEQGFSALTLACAGNHLEVVRALLAAGSDPNSRSNDGWTPLIAASYRGYSEVVQTLLRAGADPFAETADGLSALAAAKASDHDQTVDILKKHLSEQAPDGSSEEGPATILIRADVPCEIRLDGESLGPLAAGSPKKIRTSLGEHLIEAFGPDGHRWESTISILSTVQKVIDVRMLEELIKATLEPLLGHWRSELEGDYRCKAFGGTSIAERRMRADLDLKELHDGELLGTAQVRYSGQNQFCSVPSSPFEFLNANAHEEFEHRAILNARLRYDISNPPRLTLTLQAVSCDGHCDGYREFYDRTYPIERVKDRSGRFAVTGEFSIHGLYVGFYEDENPNREASSAALFRRW